MLIKSRLTKSRQFTRRHQTKIRFLLIGILNTVVGLSTYPALYYLMATPKFSDLILMATQKIYYLNILATIPYYLIILTISQIANVTFAFTTTKFLVFQTKGNYKKEIVKFLTFHFSYFPVNLVALPILVESFGVNPIIAQTSFAVMVVFSSYFWHSRITFSSN